MKYGKYCKFSLAIWAFPFDHMILVSLRSQAFGMMVVMRMEIAPEPTFYYLLSTGEKLS